jgi:hypothetical protein
MPEDNTLVNLPLWELVKSTTYGRYLICVSHYQAVTEDYQKGKAIPGVRRSKRESQFISSILGLYIDLAPKIGYPKKKEYEELQDLDDFMNPEGEALALGEAIHYFGLMRRLIEDLGLTRTEYKEQSDASRFVGGLTA